MLVAMIITFLVGGCKPEPQGELGAPFDKVAGLHGTWELMSVFQADEVNDFLDDLELTSFYRDGVTPALSLTILEDGSFAVSCMRGTNFFGNQGTWEINNPEFPSYLSLYQTDVFGNVIDSLQADLGSVVLPHSNSMGLEIRRPCSDGEEATFPVTYSFNFIRN